jgi:hypothetical protein
MMKILQGISPKWRILSLLFMLIIGSTIWFVLDSQFIPDDQRWLTKQPCAPPCWEKITPGVTTAEQAEKLMQQNELVSDVKIFSPKNHLQDSSLSWNWRSTKTPGEAYFDSLTAPHTIKRIFVNLSRPVKLKDVIIAFGYPSHVRVSAGVPNVMENPRTMYDLTFYYIQSGFYLVLDRKSVGSGFIKPIISPETTFGTVIFFAPTIDGLSNAFGWNKDLVQNTLIPWQGMLDFDTYCKLQFKSEEIDNCK